jgi:NAD(P)-dependent dehydrogenase (short-subunit alcohol dehydrogenase family)
VWVVHSVLITGANGGIGRCAVQRFDRLGWRVFAGVRSLEVGDRLAKGSKEVVPIRLDICDPASVEQARAEVERTLAGQGLNGLINNAGLTLEGPLELVPIEALRHQFEVNVIGQIAVTQAFLPALRRAKGRIANMGGAAGRAALPMYGPLSASKAALDSFSSALRMELRHQGVSVSYIEPGAIDTDFFAKASNAASTAPPGGDPEVQRIYKKAMQASSEAMATSRSSPADAAVDAMVKALTSRRPSSRYVVGLEARYGLPVLRRLPTPLRDRILMSSVGLKASSFDLVGQ